MMENEILLFYWYRKTDITVHHYTNLWSVTMTMARLLKDRKAIENLSNIYENSGGYPLPVLQSIYHRDYGHTGIKYNQRNPNPITEMRILGETKQKKSPTYFDVIMLLDKSKMQILFIFMKLIKDHNVDTGGAMNKLMAAGRIENKEEIRL